MTKKITPKQAKEELAALSASATSALKGAEVEGDEPSEVDVAAIDYSFLNYDPSDYRPYFDRLGAKPNPNLHYRWCERDHRVFTRRTAMGWSPAEGGKITNGTLVLCGIPKERAEGLRRYQAEKLASLHSSPMAAVDREADRIGSDHIQTFVGDRSVRDGLD